MRSIKQCALWISLIIFISNSLTSAVWASKNTHSHKVSHRPLLRGPLSPVAVTDGSNDNNGESKTLSTKNRPTIALALGGGGMRGAAHIGVLRVLLKEGIPIDYIAGCSMGSIVGGLYCAGISLDDIQKLLVDRSLQKAFAPGWISVALLMCPMRKYASVLTFRDRPYAGLFSGRSFRAFIDRRLPENKKHIENLDPPFVAIVTNLIDGKAYKLAHGDLADCILASSAVPPIVRPVEINGNLYVDGGVRSNVPTVSARQFGADIVIAVPVDATLKNEDPKKFCSVRNVANRVTDIVLSVVDEHHLQKADVAITPEVSDIPIFTKRKKYTLPAIKAGEDAAYKALPEIRTAIAKAQAKYSTQTSQTNEDSHLTSSSLP